MRITTKLTTFLIASSISSLSGAAEFIYFDKLSERMEELEIRPVLGATGGLAFAKVDANANYAVGDTIYDYDSHQSEQTRGVWGLFAGVELEWNRFWEWQTGIAYYQQTPFSSEGILIQNASEISPDSFSYHFKVRTYQILWENKWLTEWKERYHPYFSVGVGASVNKAEDYKTNVNPFLAFTPQYNNNSTTAFTYSFGVGVDYDVVEDCVRLGLGYRFTDLGKAGLEKSYLDTTELKHSLQTNNLYNQEIILQLTYLMP